MSVFLGVGLWYCTRQKTPENHSLFCTFKSEGRQSTCWHWYFVFPFWVDPGLGRPRLYRKIGKSKNRNSVFSIKDMHCRGVLTYFFAKTGPHAIIFYRKNWISIFGFPYFPVLPRRTSNKTLAEAFFSLTPSPIFDNFLWCQMSDDFTPKLNVNKGILSFGSQTKFDMKPPVKLSKMGEGVKLQSPPFLRQICGVGRILGGWLRPLTPDKSADIQSSRILVQLDFHHCKPSLIFMQTSHLSHFVDTFLWYIFTSPAGG